MEIQLYTKPGCPYCEKAQQVLEITKLDHSIFTLDEQFTIEEFKSIFGDKTYFPQIIIDKEKIGGCVELVKYLRKNNLV